MELKCDVTLPCVLPVFVLLSAIMHRKVIHVTFFVFSARKLQDHGFVKIQTCCYYGNVTQRPLYCFTGQFMLYNYMVSSYQGFCIVIILPEGGEAVVKAAGGV